MLESGAWTYMFGSFMSHCFMLLTIVYIYSQSSVPRLLQCVDETLWVISTICQMLISFCFGGPDPLKTSLGQRQK